ESRRGRPRAGASLPPTWRRGRSDKTRPPPPAESIFPAAGTEFGRARPLPASAEGPVLLPFANDLLPSNDISTRRQRPRKCPPERRQWPLERRLKPFRVCGPPRRLERSQRLLRPPGCRWSAEKAGARAGG